MIFAIVSAWLPYKKAKDANRNAFLWAAIAAATYIGTQLVVQLVIGTMLGVGIAAFGWSDAVLETYTIPATIVSIIASFGSTWLVLRYLDKMPEDEIYNPPPPPPNFDRTNQI